MTHKDDLKANARLCAIVVLGLIILVLALITLFSSGDSEPDPEAAIIEKIKQEHLLE